MAIRMLIDATHNEETRVAIVKGNRVEDFDFESANKKQIKGNIYLAKVTRVEPSLQAAFVDYGGNRHGFLAFSEIHPDYYQIPIADREALLAEEATLIEEYSKKQIEAEAEAEASKETDNDGATADAEVDTASATEDVTSSSVTDEGDTVSEVDHDEDDEQSSNEVIDELNTDEDDREGIRTIAANRLRRRYKIQEVIKKNQILLIQIVKEERGNKGAALTTYLSLPGRYCVLMPNTFHGGGVSRKIASPQDRKKLKSVLAEMNMPEGMACIIRTAGQDRTRTEIKRDYDYLNRMWEEIRESTLSSIAPSLIYEEGDLIKRSIRDHYTRDIDEILVDGEAGYKNAKAYMKMLMPSHARNVKHYSDNIPLFHRYQVESQLDSMYSPEVHMRSGGYIVINPTEALISIDVNSGRSTKEHNIEETAVKTNLEAAEEIARQLRLRDMAGLVVIDFIDMDDRNNNRAVERKLKECLKTDRARIQVGKISSFGLMEMSRQRLRPGMLEASTRPCPHCHGSGIIRTIDSAALYVLRAIEEEGIRKRSNNILVKVPTDVAIYLLNKKRRDLSEIETRYNFSVGISTDDTLTVPNFIMERDGQTIDNVLSEDTTPAPTETHRPPVQPREARTHDHDDSEEGRSNRRRKRKRRGRRRDSDDAVSTEENGTTEDVSTTQNDDVTTTGDENTRPASDDEGNGTRRRRRRGKRGGRRRTRPLDENGNEISSTNEDGNVTEPSTGDAPSETPAVAADASDNAVGTSEEAPKRRRPPRRRRKPQSADSDAQETPADDSAPQAEAPVITAAEPVSATEAEAPVTTEEQKKPARRRTPRQPKEEAVSPESKPEKVTEKAPEVAAAAVKDVPVERAPTAEPPAKPRKGWWQKALGN